MSRLGFAILDGLEKRKRDNMNRVAARRDGLSKDEIIRAIAIHAAASTALRGDTVEGMNCLAEAFVKYIKTGEIKNKP